MDIKTNIGLSASVRLQIAQNLSLLLADTFALYVKTQNFYWNMIDSRFYALHLFLKQEYESLSNSNEAIAERIRILGERYPGTLKQFLDMTSLKESDGDLTAEEMLLDLINDHEAICRFLRDRIILITQLGDETTKTLLINQLAKHEKSAWMLRSQQLPLSI